jgi:uncharacterized protein (TIGR01777 family)
MYIVVTGSTGLVGEAVCRRLMDEGHRVGRLVRPASNFQAPQGTWSEWDPKTGLIDPKFLDGADAVIHLAGENIAGWWTAKKMKRIVDSRVEGTALLAKTLAGLMNKPKLFLCASATGFYGDRPDETLDEHSKSGAGFLAETCRRWEDAAQSAKDAGIRTAHMRLGMVLDSAGGAVKAILPIFSLGLGGKIASGDQYWSWITLDDVTGAISYLLSRDDVEGVYNFTAPEPVTNERFTKAMGKALKRPTLLPVPETVITLVADGMADELLLASQRVVPAHLEEAGYRFAHPHIEGALQAVV